MFAGGLTSAKLGTAPKPDARTVDHDRAAAATKCVAAVQQGMVVELARRQAPTRLMLFPNRNDTRIREFRFR